MIKIKSATVGCDADEVPLGREEEYGERDQDKNPGFKVWWQEGPLS